MLANPWLMLVAGVVGGGLIVWAVDRMFVRAGFQSGARAQAKAEAEGRLMPLVNDQKRVIEELRSEMIGVNMAHREEVEKLEADLEFAKRLATGRIVAEASGYELNDRTYAKAVTRDQLQRIAGVGPKFEKMFWQAGVYRFSQIATLTETQIKDIISAEPWQIIDSQRWIDEATRLSAGD